MATGPSLQPLYIFKERERKARGAGWAVALATHILTQGVGQRSKCGDWAFLVHLGLGPWTQLAAVTFSLGLPPGIENGSGAKKTGNTFVTWAPSV